MHFPRYDVDRFKHYEMDVVWFRAIIPGDAICFWFTRIFIISHVYQNKQLFLFVTITIITVTDICHLKNICILYISDESIKLPQNVFQTSKNVHLNCYVVRADDAIKSILIAMSCFRMYAHNINRERIFRFALYLFHIVVIYVLVGF